ncbi:MAG: rhomboid family intramembrane serine protease [Acidobacteriia bacterium]|nr:rhomboid family intramembrane serine protease [Terriglobia bacterium]
MGRRGKSVDPRQPYRRHAEFGGFGWPGSRPTPDLVFLLAILFGTYALQFFEATAVVPALLRLTPAVWRLGYLWQLVTYPLVGFGSPSLWILLELLVVFWFGQDVRARLGRRRFWTLLLAATAGAAGIAALVQLVVSSGLGGSPTAFPFQLMQGQRMVLAVLIAAFATLAGDATILLFFVLPIRARWCLWLGILLAFVAYLGTKDLAGFAGICGATGITALALSRRSPQRGLRVRWLEWRGRRLGRKIDRLAKRRGLRVIRRDDDRGGPTIN